MNSARVKLLTWEKFNEKRKDVKNPSWLRLENDFPMSQSMFGLNAVDVCVFVTLMCLASKKQAAEIEFDVEWFCHFGGNRFTAEQAAESFMRMHGRCIEVVQPGSFRSRPVPVTCPEVNATERGPLRTDETDGPNETDVEDVRVGARIEAESLVFDQPQASGVASVCVAGDDAAPEQYGLPPAFGNCAWAHPSIREFLALQPVPIKAQLGWVNKCGMDAIFVEAELHKAIAHWDSDEDTQRRYTDPATGRPQIARYVNRWLTRAWDRPRAPAQPEPPDDSPPTPPAAYVHTGAAIKQFDLDAEEARANPADPSRVRQLVDQITGRTAATR